MPEDAGSLLAGLGGQFPEEELAATGLLVRKANGELELSTNLMTSPRVVAVLRATAESTPYDILGPCGSLAGEQVPCLTAARDAYTAECLPEWRKCLFLAFDVVSLAILRSLGLPVTLAHGLEGLDGDGLRGLLGEPRGLTQGPTRPSPAGCTEQHELWNTVDKLVLVGWSVAGRNGKKPPGLQAVAERLGAASSTSGSTPRGLASGGQQKSGCGRSNWP